MIIKVRELIGSELLINEDDAKRLFDVLSLILRENQSVIISFERIHIITAGFLSASIGKLYNSFKEQQIRDLVKIQGLDNTDLKLLKYVVDNAKKYYNTVNYPALNDWGSLAHT